ncbi:MAG: hypothetical protein ACREMZ_03405 [Gemmatimonadales bacterium]
MPYPGDSDSPEACVHALYETISGPPERARDWQRFRALCHPDARFLLATVGADGAPQTRWWDVEEFIREGIEEFSARGLWEHELVGHTDRFGRIAQVFSVYVACLDRPDSPVVARGVNCVQLVEESVGDTAAWRIVHLAWDRERAGNMLQPEFGDPPAEAAA